MSWVNKLKSLSWVAIAGACVTAVLMVLGGAKVGREERKARQLEGEIEALKHDMTKQGINRAAKLQEKKNTHLKKAETVLAQTESRLERISEDDTMADIAERFNNRSVRKRTSTTA